MIEVTDPAKELAELCEILAKPNPARGDAHLANLFGVSAWSSDFYRIIFNILDRADFVASIIDTLDIDEDNKADAKGCLNRIKDAFSQQSLLQNWNSAGAGHALLKPENALPIKMLSGLVRHKVSYPKLSDEAREDLLNEVETLQSWLKEHQLAEKDFVRQALIDGVEHFKFRLQRLRWLGWGYTVESLREIISAYMMLERVTPTNNTAPDAEAVMRKVDSLLRRVYQYTGAAKEAAERTEFLVNLYTVSTVALKAGLAGYLTFNP